MCFYGIFNVQFSLGYVPVGCYKDTLNRSIQIIERTDSILDGSYFSRSDPIAKCAVAAMRAGYGMFALQNGGQCAASATAPQTFDKYGKSAACKADGEGGPSANQVYLIKGETKINKFHHCLAFIDERQPVTNIHSFSFLKFILFICVLLSLNSIPLIHVIFTLSF